MAEEEEEEEAEEGEEGAVVVSRVDRVRRLDADYRNAALPLLPSAARKEGPGAFREVRFPPCKERDDLSEPFYGCGLELEREGEREGGARERKRRGEPKGGWARESFFSWWVFIVCREVQLGRHNSCLRRAWGHGFFSLQCWRLLASIFVVNAGQVRRKAVAGEHVANARRNKKKKRASAYSSCDSRFPLALLALRSRGNAGRARPTYFSLRLLGAQLSHGGEKGTMRAEFTRFSFVFIKRTEKEKAIVLTRRSRRAPNASALYVVLYFSLFPALFFLLLTSFFLLFWTMTEEDGARMLLH